METIKKDGFNLVRQTDGPDLGYSSTSGVKIIEVDGKAFKSFDGSDTLLPYEDWRLPMEERAADLASRLSVDEIAGLMLYSIQNKLPMPNDTYGGKPFAESGMKAYDLSDAQIKFLTDDNLRHVLVSTVESPETAARWNNKVQALIEGRTHGIPANNSSDPRHSAFADAEFSPGSDGSISLWSNMLGLAATFSPETVEEFGRIAREEYRALGLATALSPQADLGTDPRWYRYSSTFGPEPRLVTDLTHAYADGFQTDPTAGGWGNGSVNAMVKHWPGGGSGEGGRDAHYGNGKFAVYPGGCYEQHKIPFLEGAFKLTGGTEKASAVMPYYTISYNQTDENVGNGFNREIISRQLREEAGYDGVVCTDWIITGDEAPRHPFRQAVGCGDNERGRTPLQSPDGWRRPIRRQQRERTRNRGLRDGREGAWRRMDEGAFRTLGTPTAAQHIPHRSVRERMSMWSTRKRLWATLSSCNVDMNSS